MTGMGIRSESESCGPAVYATFINLHWMRYFPERSAGAAGAAGTAGAAGAGNITLLIAIAIAATSEFLYHRDRGCSGKIGSCRQILSAYRAQGSP